ncbi:hypothetical protein Y603_3802 [Burkholderia pseudomallei MSHR1153]|nr:hypothetical protein Y603_3802 [Burkholderia pseudomallei MSHR1153]
MAERGRASGRYPPDLPDQTSGGHRGRDAGCESELQTANCKLQTANCKLQTGSLDVLRSSAVEARVNWATQSFQTRQPSRIFELRVFEPSRLPVFPSSRLHVFTSSRLRDIETSRRSNRSRITRAIQLARPFAHSLTSPTLPLLRLSPSLVRARPTRVGRLASPHRVTPSGASAPKPLRHATPHARLSRARGRRRDCARPPSPDRAPDRPPRRSRRYAARTRRPDATPRRRR